MKKTLLLGAAAIAAAFTAMGATPSETPQAATPEGWELVWEDDFTDSVPDPTVWRRTERGKPDWAKTQSSDPRCLEMRDGLLVLRGIVNDDLTADPSPYLCGGLITKDLKAFEPGRFEIRARLHDARGAWPAIWLLPADGTGWPNGGEIDIMERLNSDSIAYQTVHSHYTYDLRQTGYPQSSRTAPIRPGEFNVYGVEVHPDSVVFSINGVTTHTYPRIATDKEGQFPYYRPQYMLIDMQLGGKWVGEVDPADLPVEMEVDWVRHYLPASRPRE